MSSRSRCASPIPRRAARRISPRATIPTSRTCTATSAASPSTSSIRTGSQSSAAWRSAPTWWSRTTAPTSSTGSADYEALKPINKRLVYASISGFGQDGPYRDRPGVDQIAQGMAGRMSITGPPGSGPNRVGIAISDLAAGLFTAFGVMVALWERERSGEGQRVETSLLQALIFLLDFQGARYLMKGEVPRQVGNYHPTGAPTGTYRTRDGHINIAPTPPMWRRLCGAIGREDLVAHPDYATAALRRKNRDALGAVIESITAQETSAHWIERLNKAGIPCGPIYAIDETFADPQVRHLGIAQEVVSKALGPITILGQPLALSRTPTRLVAAAPEYGEHTDAILAELGYSAAEIAELRAKGAV